ncbi:MAG TPA: hypothetical protein VJR71_10515 [Pseudolabrys sp.]|nr:hypothetical protein [Pseudolabrys sp.]
MTRLDAQIQIVKAISARCQIFLRSNPAEDELQEFDAGERENDGGKAQNELIFRNFLLTRGKMLMDEAERKNEEATGAQHRHHLSCRCPFRPPGSVDVLRNRLIDLKKAQGTNERRSNGRRDKAGNPKRSGI